jgi:glutaminyl-tRNA synthetase
VLPDAVLEPALATARPGEIFQFERQGYFVVDTGRAGNGQSVFSRTVSLRDSWAKLERQALQDAKK